MQHEKWVFGLHISGHSWLRDAISRMQDKKMEMGIEAQSKEQHCSGLLQWLARHLI